MEWYQNLYGTGSGTVHKHKLIFFDEDVSCSAQSEIDRREKEDSRLLKTSDSFVLIIRKHDETAKIGKRIVILKLKRFLEMFYFLT